MLGMRKTRIIIQKKRNLQELDTSFFESSLGEKQSLNSGKALVGVIATDKTQNMNENTGDQEITKKKTLTKLVRSTPTLLAEKR